MSLPAGVSAVLPWSPDWKTPVEETFAFKTNVLRSRDRTPQYRALRTKPRASMRYTVLLDGDDAAAFDYRLWAAQPYVWMLPQWTRRRFLASAASLGSSTLVLDAPVSYLSAAGDELILMRDGQDPEVYTLDTVSGDRLTLTTTEPLENDWAARTAVYPAWQAQFSADVRADKITDGVLQAPLVLRQLVHSRAPVASSLVADLTVGGLEVLIRPINWAQGMEVHYGWVPEFLDAQVGPFDYVAPGTVAPRSRQGTVLCESRDEIDWWLGFFARVRGMQKPFLVPTWQGDLRLQDPLAGGDFEVAGSDLGRYMPANGVYTHLMVRLKDGSLAFYEVDAVTPDYGLGVTSITTVVPWGEAYGPWECIQACFVAYAHLASDTLTVSWITDEVAKITLGVMDEETPA